MKKILSILCLVILTSCGGGGSSGPKTIVPGSAEGVGCTATEVQSPIAGVIIDCSGSQAFIPFGVIGQDGQDGQDGQNGTNGLNGQSCIFTDEPENNRVKLDCSGNIIFINHGNDGANGNDGVDGSNGNDGVDGLGSSGNSQVPSGMTFSTDSSILEHNTGFSLTRDYSIEERIFDHPSNSTYEMKGHRLCGTVNDPPTITNSFYQYDGTSSSSTKSESQCVNVGSQVQKQKTETDWPINTNEVIASDVGLWGNRLFYVYAIKTANRIQLKVRTSYGYINNGTIEAPDYIPNSQFGAPGIKTYSIFTIESDNTISLPSNSNTISGISISGLDVYIKTNKGYFVSPLVSYGGYLGSYPKYTWNSSSLEFDSMIWLGSL